MEPLLNPIEVRTLACLVEKSLSTPEYYPLTLNALTAACNQKSNRDPMMQISDQDTVRALDSLRDRRLASSVTLAGSRTPKYRHGIENVFPLTPPQLAVLCELMLRGPQTVGELRTRASRLCSLADTAEVQSVLQQLMAWPGAPLAAVAPRQSGQREERYTHLLAGSPPASTEPAALPVAEPARLSVMAENERLATLEAKVSVLEDELARLNARLADFTHQFQ
ncbi:MAG: YceH family protein [bacterium]